MTGDGSPPRERSESTDRCAAGARPPTDVLVAIPAHDEARTIGGCLDAVAVALDHARRVGAVGRARVAVAAHRCRDDTATLARDHLEGRSGIEVVVLEEPAELRVGALRGRLIAHALAAPPALAGDSWILSTDADTIVGREWVVDLLAAAREAGADLVLGLAELDRWDADEEALRAYRELIESGIHGDAHDHAYAANLAISAEAYRAAGGFTAVLHGEEHALADAVRTLGRRVISPLHPQVVTSARSPGRASSGLGDLLGRLSSSRARAATG